MCRVNAPSECATTTTLARHCVRSLARSLAHSLTHSHSSSWDSGIFLSNFQCVLSHSGMTMKSTHRVLGHSLVCSLVHSHRTLICFLHTACFACALRCAHSFVRSLARSRAHGIVSFLMSHFQTVLNHSASHWNSV